MVKLRCFGVTGCSKCFKLRKIYEEAAQRLDDEKPSVTMAAVNIAEGMQQLGYMRAKFLKFVIYEVLDL